MRVTDRIRPAALLLAIPAAAIVLVACGSSTTATITVEVTTTEAAPPANTPPVKSEANLTTAQKNAVRAAQSYLGLGAFSKEGLIDLLSSSAADGYHLHDATVAVNRLKVNWNQQAARAAHVYEVGGSSFSCKELVQQLSSADRFTTAQAQFGAKQAGVC